MKALLMRNRALRLLIGVVAATPVVPILAVVADAALSPGPISARAAPSWINNVTADGVVVEQAWARASAGGATTAAAYVTLKGGSAADRLVGVDTPAADTAAVHESFTDNGVMKMRPVTALPIPAGASVTFSPGSYHVMLTGLRRALVAGERFPLTFRFEHEQPITVEVLVRAIGRDISGTDHTGDHDRH